MQDTKLTEQERTAYRAELLAPLLALHPKTAKPTHGCCAPPKLCSGHPPECRSSEHQIGSGTPWPCRTLRAVGITNDADAAAVLGTADEQCKCGFRAPELGPHPLCPIHGEHDKAVAGS